MALTAGDYGDPPPNLILPRSDEYWNDGVLGAGPIPPPPYPILQLSSQPFQVLAEVPPAAPRFIPRIRRSPRSVVAGRAGDIAAGRKRPHINKPSMACVLAPAVNGRFSCVIAGIFPYHPVAAVHISIVALDIEGRRRIGGKNIVFVQIRRELLPHGKLLLKPLVTRLVPVQRIAPEIVGHQLPHERGRLAWRRLCGIVIGRRRAVHERFARQLSCAAVFKKID